MLGLSTIASPAGAAAGDLDPSFGAGGKVTTDFFGRDDFGSRGLLIQPDGKIVLTGLATTTSTQQDFALARYDTNGSLDTTFGAGGKVNTDFFGREDSAQDAVLQPDGKILGAGYARKTNGDLDIALARYDTGGSLDATFGAGGKVTTNFGCPPGPFGEEAAGSVALQADLKIVIAGTCSSNFQVVRYLPNGALDVAFGAGGRAVANFGGTSGGLSVLVQPDQRIVAGGPVSQATRNWGLARFLSNGALDGSFGGSGVVVTDFGGLDDGPWDLTVQGTTLVGVGYASNNFGIARWMIANGSLDASFGSGGKVTTDFGAVEGAFGVAVQTDNKLVVVGGSPNFELARYNPNGSLDAAFGTGGKVVTSFGGDAGARGVGIQLDGKIVVGGFARGSLGYDFALARYQGAGVGPPASVTLDPAAATNDVGTNHEVTATVRDSTGNPVPAITVRFSVQGSVTTTGSCVTDNAGQCSFQYQGPNFPGQDAIGAFADTDNDGTQDPGEPSGITTKTWVLPASTPDCGVIIKGGWFIADSGNRATFGGESRVSPSGAPSGQEEYADHGDAGPMTIKSRSVDAVTCTPDLTSATIHGKATVDGTGSFDFVLQVRDLDKVGLGTDRYRVLVSNGYDSGDHELRGGQVEIR